MPQIPVVPKLQPDELLYSWMLRIARANGFEKLNDFFEIYVWPEYYGTKKRHQRIQYDIRHDLSVLCEALGGQWSLIELFRRTSIFSGVSSLMSRSRASQYIGMMSRSGSETSMRSIPNNLVSKLLVCPHCQKNDYDTFGDFAFYRAHHMPGVTVCHKHGCALLAYEADKDIDQMTILEEKPEALAHAKFCYDMLYSGIQCDLQSIKKQVPSVVFSHYADHEGILVQLMQQFSTVAEIKTCIVTVSQRMKFEQATNGCFTLISPWREDVIELRCNACGREFITTPDRVISGWGCPKCDSAFTDEETFQRFFDAQNDGTYSLLSAFTGMSNRIEIYHSSCGKAWKTRARNFIIENVRCKCENMISEEKARAAIEASGEFEMVAFESVSKPVQIRHLKCKRVFCWNYHKFLKYPWCKLCSPNVSCQDMFAQEIKDLVGNEYTLIGNYVDRTTKVGIRHNRCNCVQGYLPARFLDGGRCSECTPEYTRSELARVVREVSFGKYNWIGPKTNNLEIVVDTETGEEKYLSQARILQELLRPTLSPILPLRERNMNVLLPMTNAEIVFTWLHSHYTHNELISLEDIKPDGLNYALTKSATQILVEEGKLVRLEPGILSFPGVTFTPHEMIVHKYLIRNGNRIGYLTDHSFAYELGLREEKPQRMGIVTNQESQLHGRNRTFLGMDLKIHGSRIPVDDGNYPILAVISFVLNEKRLKCCTRGNKNEVLRRWLAEKDIDHVDFEPYYQHFPSWTRNMIVEIFAEDIS